MITFIEEITKLILNPGNLLLVIHWIPQNPVELPQHSAEFLQNRVEFPQNPVEFPQNPVEFPQNPAEFPQNPVEFPQNHVEFSQNPVELAFWPSVQGFRQVASRQFFPCFGARLNSLKKNREMQAAWLAKMHYFAFVCQGHRV